MIDKLPALNDSIQESLLEKFKEYFHAIPFTENKKDGLRYYYDNPWYAYADGVFLHCMMRHLKPKRIIEVGCGFTSSVMVDTNTLFMDSSIHFTFIDPNHSRTNELMSPKDLEKHTVINDIVQNCDRSLFQSLQENDILFIDSSHKYAKGTDLEYLFSIIPDLKKGVIVHFHDIFYPFEYLECFKEHKFNEIPYLRDFLLNNPSFQIELFSHYIVNKNPQWFVENMPLCLKNPGGNIWIRKQQ